MPEISGRPICSVTPVVIKAATMRLVRLPEIEKGWHRRAACRGYEDELWDLDVGSKTDQRLGQLICNTMCTERLSCLRDALKPIQGAFGSRSDIGVIRGGVKLKEDNRRAYCVMCGFRVAITDKRRGICHPCRKYRPCAGGCGRGIGQRRKEEYCNWCEKEREEHGAQA